MSDPAPTIETRHVSARLPEVLAAQIDIVRAKRGLKHYSDALAYVVDRGLDAIAALDRKPERLEAMVARTEDLTVTIVAVLNLVHELDPEAVERTRKAVLAQLDARSRRRPIPDAHGLGFRVGEGGP